LVEEGLQDKKPRSLLGDSGLSKPRQQHVGIKYRNKPNLEGMQASEFSTGVFERFKTRCVNEQQKQAHVGLVQESAYMWLCTRLVSELLSRAERIHVKEFGAIVLRD
jgi:hypothetical protein